VSRPKALVPVLVITCASLVCAHRGLGAQAPAAPGPIQMLDVPYIAQTEALCGGAAAAMVLRFWGERGLTAESFAHLVDESASGIRTTTLIDDLRRRGWNANGVKGSDAILLRELERGRPPMVLIEDRPGSFHYAVVVASLPSTVVLHDPARAPFRAMSRDEFARRWEAADRWVAVVVPDGSRNASAPAVAVTPAAATGNAECQTRIATASRLTGEGDYDAAARALTEAPACSAAVTFRELAGVRAVQKRWAEATEPAQAAVDADRSDPVAWRLLGTSLFLQDDQRGALRAWNEAGEPRLDTLQINGLRRTRVPVAVRAARVKAGDPVTPSSVLHVQRRLDSVPSISRASVEYVPRPNALADMRAQVSERTLFPKSMTAVAAVAAPAVFNRTVRLPISAPTGGGERLDFTWRFQDKRPRVALDFAAPAPWGGVWGVGGSWERQPFEADFFPRAERRSARASWEDWLTPYFRVGVHGGGDSWANRESTLTTAGVEALFATGAERMRAQIQLDSWFGDDPFSRGHAVIHLTTSTAKRGWVALGQVGAGLLGDSAPPDIWFGGDTSTSRPTPLRAHRLVADGLMTTTRIGRTVFNTSVEGQHWWVTKRGNIGAAAFLDLVSVDRRVGRGRQRDADVGIGLRAGVPGSGGNIRVDLARGLRDGAMRASVGFEP
jgi:predicted double-glycine peptidase